MTSGAALRAADDRPGPVDHDDVDLHRCAEQHAEGGVPGAGGHQVAEAGIRRTAIVVVGRALAAAEFPDSHLYSTTRAR